jgi:hypothetical protein
MLIREIAIDTSTNAVFSESGIFEAFTDSRNDLFKACQKEYGRCVSPILIETRYGTKVAGWVFQKKDYYEDTHEPFIRETWVEVQ